MKYTADPPATLPLGIGALVNSIPTALDARNKFKKFWEEIEERGPQAAEQLLGEVIKAHPEITQIVNEFQESINKLVDQARYAHDKIQAFIVGKGITMESVSTLLSKEVGKIYEDLKGEVDDPSPEDQRRRSGVARDRTQLVSQIMKKVGVVYIHVLTGVGVPQQVAEIQFSDFSSMIVRVALIAGQIVDKYPSLFGIIRLVLSIRLSFSGLPLLLRLILPVLGFGPLGPIKGSAAAWAQRTLWGHAVATSSWFAVLQQLGMTQPRGLSGILFESAGLLAARL